jgi:CDP-diacylglycerol--glycerol-3-phosphate 3-phosphatidyltransferase
MPRALPRQITHPVVGVLAKLGVTPNMLTVAQLLGGVLAGYVIATGELLAGGILVLLASALDAFDGTLARTTGKVTKFGGVFDSTIDRMFEGAVLGGVLWYYLEEGDKTASLLVFIAGIGSLCVSYVRARAESTGIEIYDGIFTRVVRIIILVAGLVTGQVKPVLWLLAVMTTVTAFHRLYAVYQKLRPIDEAAQSTRQ